MAWPPKGELGSRFLAFDHLRVPARQADCSAGVAGRMLLIRARSPAGRKSVSGRLRCQLPASRSHTEPTLTNGTCRVLDSAPGGTGQRSDSLNDRLASHNRRWRCCHSRTEPILDQSVTTTAASQNLTVGQATNPCVRDQPDLVCAQLRPSSTQLRNNDVQHRAFSIGDGRRITRGRGIKREVSQEMFQRERVMRTAITGWAAASAALDLVEKRRRKQGRRLSCASSPFEGDHPFEGNRRRKNAVMETPKERGNKIPKYEGVQLLA